WIEYDTFRNIEEVGRGGFSVVYKTSYKRQYETYEDVAIKIIKDSHKNNQLFLNELKAYHELGNYFGISMDKNSGDFILVLNYAEFGSLRENLVDIFKLEWKVKLKLLCDIINDLSNIHSKNFIHRNLHPGNILLKGQYEAYIDLGSSISVDEKQNGIIYGVLPYLAPEKYNRSNKLENIQKTNNKKLIS
ncbi:2312_t:CDS:2, partial [Ambispora leptoticha]